MGWSFFKAPFSENGHYLIYLVAPLKISPQTLLTPLRACHVQTSFSLEALVKNNQRKLFNIVFVWVGELAL